MSATATRTAIPTPATCRAWIPRPGAGLVTNVAIKRKIRNYVAMARGDAPGHDIYMQAAP